MPTSNPRKIRQTGSSLGVTIPPEILADVDLEQGDRVVLETAGSVIRLEQVEWSRTSEDGQ